jgi:hypothetical protein
VTMRRETFLCLTKVNLPFPWDVEVHHLTLLVLHGDGCENYNNSDCRQAHLVVGATWATTQSPENWAPKIPPLSQAMSKIPPLVHRFSSFIKGNGRGEKRIVFCLFISIAVLQWCTSASSCKQQ